MASYRLGMTTPTKIRSFWLRILYFGVPPPRIAALIAGLGASLIPNPQLDLVRVPLQFWRVHRIRTRRQGAELAGDLGAHLVADRVLAAGQVPHEERDLL